MSRLSLEQLFTREFLDQCELVLREGDKHRGRNTWDRRGQDHHLLKSARHLWKALDGKPDQDSGASHLAHATVRAVMAWHLRDKEDE